MTIFGILLELFHSFNSFRKILADSTAIKIQYKLQQTTIRGRYNKVAVKILMALIITVVHFASGTDLDKIVATRLNG